MLVVVVGVVGDEPAGRAEAGPTETATVMTATEHPTRNPTAGQLMVR
jgi:hypothetical protein